MLIDLYYKLRDARKDALELCVRYCREDIEALPVFIEAYKKTQLPEDFLPEIPSVIRLAIIYEKRGEYQDAIDLCNQAIHLGLEQRYEWYNKTYGKKEGYAERIKRIQNRMNRTNPKNSKIRLGEGNDDVL